MLTGKRGELGENPPEGYVFLKRPKKKVVERQRGCYEYTLKREEEVIE